MTDKFSTLQMINHNIDYMELKLSKENYIILMYYIKVNIKKKCYDIHLSLTTHVEIPLYITCQKGLELNLNYVHKRILIR
uniref:Uncharacterized protein n=1 Tax=Strongyloides papillosus TaxID=174720 RepID=A0A0N5BX33_STREA